MDTSSVVCCGWDGKDSSRDDAPSSAATQMHHYPTNAYQKVLLAVVTNRAASRCGWLQRSNRGSSQATFPSFLPSLAPLLSSHTLLCCWFSFISVALHCKLTLHICVNASKTSCEARGVALGKLIASLAQVWDSISGYIHPPLFLPERERKR